MRIAFFSDTYLPQVNGVVTCVSQLAESLAEQGHKVLVVCPRAPGMAKLPTKKNLTVLMLPSVPALLYPQFRIGAMLPPKMLASLRSFKPEIVHFHTPMSVGLLAIAAAKLLHVPLVGTNHLYLTKENDDFLKSLHRNPQIVKAASACIRLYSKFLYDFCDLLIVPSPRLLSALKKEGYKGKAISLPNPIPVSKPSSIARPLRERLRKQYRQQKFVVLHTGRLSLEKNVDGVLKAFAELRKQRTNVSLLVIGDGPAKKELERLAKKLQIQNDVRFTGFMAHEELLSSGVLGLGDVFVTASTMENQPMAVLEAMGFGLPVIGVDAGGMPDLIGEKNGFLVKPHDHRAIAKSIEKVLSDSSLRSRLSRASKKSVDVHSVKHVTAALLKEYKVLLKIRR